MCLGWKYSKIPQTLTGGQKMNLKKMSLYLLLAVFLISSLAACAPKSDPPVVLYDYQLDNVMNNGSIVASRVEGGDYIVECFEMKVGYKWYAEKDLVDGNTKYTVWLIYEPNSPTVTVSLTVAENNSVVWEIEPEFNKESDSWKDQLVYLANENGFESGVVPLLSSIDLKQTLSDVDKEVLELFGQYVCTRLEQ